ASLRRQLDRQVAVSADGFRRRDLRRGCGGARVGVYGLSRGEIVDRGADDAQEIVVGDYDRDRTGRHESVRLRFTNVIPASGRNVEAVLATGIGLHWAAGEGVVSADADATVEDVVAAVLEEIDDHRLQNRLTGCLAAARRVV